MNNNLKRVEILLVEDNPGDVRLTQEALKESKVLNYLHVAWDGEEALNFLFKRGEYHSKPTPDIIFLDLNLPKVNGREVLAKVKSTPSLRQIPVVVLTTSELDADVTESYNLQANCYVVKPLGFSEFIRAVKTIDHFWLSIVTLPGYKL